MAFRTLDAARIVETLERLDARISERFPQAGLAQVCAETVSVARQTAARAAAIAEPILWLRIGVAVLLAAGVAAQIAAARLLHVTVVALDITSFLQGLEAAVNLLLLFGGGVWFLLTMEERIKRQRVLDALHELRSLAHVIDMHQLTKDPTMIHSGESQAPGSIHRGYSPFELSRYLDYCSEMLSLTAKVAALYAQSSSDPIVIDAVNDLERLTTNLRQGVWQKITLIRGLSAG